MTTKKLSLILMCTALLGFGCAKKKRALYEPVGATPGASPSSPLYPGRDGTPIAPDGTNTTGKVWDDGATADFTPVSEAIFEDYVAQRPLNNPTHYRVNVDLAQNTADGSYGGTVRIGYFDNGQWHEGIFESGFGQEPVYGREETMYNQWFNWKGNYSFHGFFADSLGAIVLVVDRQLDYGDGQGARSVSGSIWYKNFETTRAPESPTKCWFVKTPKGAQSTPYDCRTFLHNGEVLTYSALYPSTADGYRKLGSFTGLEKHKAFNQ